MSSTFTLPDTDIPVTLCDDLSAEELQKFPAFKNWFSRTQYNFSLQHSNPSHPFHADPYKIRSITVKSVTRFSTTRIGFMVIDANTTNSKDERLPEAIFLRGPSVAMMIILQPDDVEIDSEDEKHVLLTVQPRLPGGSLEFVELPAGMVDDGTFSGKAADEIKEEIGLEIPEDELLNLSELVHVEQEGEDKPAAMFPSAGGCDEYIQIFLHEKRVPRKELKEWTGRLTGLRARGELITLKLIKLEKLWIEGACDAKASTAWSLYSGLKKMGKL